MRSLKYIERFTDRLGIVRFYFRRNKVSIRIALPDPVDIENPSDEFMRAYNEAVAIDPCAKTVGSIYVIEFLNWVKIGFSREPVSRLKALQVSIPLEAKIVKVFKGTIKMERCLHSRFGAYREQGEWFRKEGTLAEWLNHSLGVLEIT